VIYKTQLLPALLLTFLAGVSTVLGSLITFFMRDFKKSYLQFSLGLSADIMIYVSFVELLSLAIANIGFLKANAAFFCGVIVVMLFDFFVPHVYIEEKVRVGNKDRKIMAEGLTIALGVAIHNFPEGWWFL
jgi:ZIP family zinc transporter